MMPDLMFWGRLLGVLTLELALVPLVIGILARWMSSPHIRRALWQAASLAMVLLLVGELLGWRGAVMRSISHAPRSAVPDLAVSTPASPAETPRSRPVPEVTEPPRVLPEPRASEPVWWPGKVWLIGSGLLVFRVLVIQLRLVRRRRRGSWADDGWRETMQKLREPLRLPPVGLQVWSELRGPVAFGLVRPTVAVPPDFSVRFTPRQCEAMLVHELAHLAGRDPWWRLWSDLVCAAIWWHPGGWWVRHQLRAASEEAADDASGLAPQGREALAESLVRFGRELTTPGLARGLGVAGSGFRSELGKRVTALLDNSGPWRPVPAWGRWRTRVLVLSGVTALSAVPWGPEGPSIVRCLLPVTTAATPERAVPVVLQNQAPIEVNPSIGEAGVPDAPGDSPLVHTRTFKLKPKSFLKAVGVSEGASPREIQRTVGEFFRQCGLPFPGSEQSRTAMFFNDQSGVLFVRAELAQLETVERILDRLGMSGPADANEVSIAVTIAEVPAGSDDDFELDWLFGVSRDDNPLEETRPWSGRGRGRVEELRNTNQVAVLNARQFAALRDRLSEREGVDLLKAPDGIAQLGRLMQVSIQEMRSVVTGVEAVVNETAKATGFDAVSVSPTNQPGINYQVEEVPVGAVVTLTPERVADGWKLEVTVRSSEFLGYDDPRPDPAPEIAVKGGRPLTATRPLPRMRVREMQASSWARAGDTVALRGARVSRLEMRRSGVWPFRRTETNQVERRLYAFVTPSIAEPGLNDVRTLQPMILQVHPENPSFRVGDRQWAGDDLASVLATAQPPGPNRLLLIQPMTAESVPLAEKVQQEAQRLGISIVLLPVGDVGRP